VAVSFIGGGNRRIPEKATDLPQKRAVNILGLAGIEPLL
jgi:hypothetical protein